MRIKPILILTGDPKSIFFEIFFKSCRVYKSKSPIILVSSRNILLPQMSKYKFKKKIRIINVKNLVNYKLDNKFINLINIKYNQKNKNVYLKNCFDISFRIIKDGLTNKFINGPISKAQFLNKRFLGITEYISGKFNINKFAMLIYNKDLSVCPLTTHMPIKLVSKRINRKSIHEKIKLIDQFFKKNFGIKPKIAVTGLNPHCETILNVNEDKQIIIPTVKFLKRKGYKVFGPFPADTIFLKQNRRNYNVILGMYHDQVISPLKTLKEYDAFNITLGLPFYRISPDHGPNIKMVNKNISNPLSLIRALKFLDKK